jgi:hypothetical protein
MGKNHQFWLVKTQLELGLIFRTGIRLGTEFLILLIYGTGIKRYIYIYISIMIVSRVNCQF